MNEWKNCLADFDDCRSICMRELRAMLRLDCCEWMGAG